MPTSRGTLVWVRRILSCQNSRRGKPHVPWHSPLLVTSRVGAERHLSHSTPSRNTTAQPINCGQRKTEVPCGPDARLGRKRGTSGLPDTGTTILSVQR